MLEVIGCEFNCGARQSNSETKLWAPSSGLVLEGCANSVLTGGGCLSRDPSGDDCKQIAGIPLFCARHGAISQIQDHLNACPSDLSSWLEARIVMAKMAAAIAEKSCKTDQ